MSERPVVETKITQHTLWQALTGSPPPPTLAAGPISRAVLDSRDIEPDGLFIALAGRQTDGHNFIQSAILGGAGAILCEERGIPHLQEANALIVDCRDAHHPLRPVAQPPVQQLLSGRTVGYVVPDATEALQAVGLFQRLHRTQPGLQVIGITGSVGKTSTKELTASVLAQRFCTHRNVGNLNSEQGLPLSLLGLHPGHERAVLEMGMYSLGEIRYLCSLARPQIGVVTNVGPSHLERMGTMERIAQAKGELVESLPSAADGGVAILNWDDERVRAMADRTEARVFFYGLNPDADLWADEIESLGMEGIRFRFHHRQPDGNVHTLYLKVPLLGRHSVHTALRAAAVGIVNELTWQEIATGLQKSQGQLRLVVVPGLNGGTIIDDTYNASPSSTLAALNLLGDLRNGSRRRRIAVLGDMRELGDFTAEGHQQVGIRAAAVVDLLVTVGELGRMIADEAIQAGLPEDAVIVASNYQNAVQSLKELILPQDIVLVKGSRAVGMDRIVSEITLDQATLVAAKAAG